MIPLQSHGAISPPISTLDLNTLVTQPELKQVLASCRSWTHTWKSSTFQTFHHWNHMETTTWLSLLRFSQTLTRWSKSTSSAEQETLASFYHRLSVLLATLSSTMATSSKSLMLMEKTPNHSSWSMLLRRIQLLSLSTRTRDTSSKMAIMSNSRKFRAWLSWMA